MNENINTSIQPSGKDEIDFVVLLKKLWQGRKTIIITTVAGIAIGLFVAFASPKEFKVVTTMLPQSESGGGMSKFSSLASLAGFDLNLDQNSSEISPVIYPQIVESEPFMMEMINTPFTFSDVDHPVSIFDYYNKIRKPSIFEYVYGYTVGLPGTIKGALKKKSQNVSSRGKGNGLHALTQDEYDMINFMKGRLQLTINKKEGYLTLTCSMEEPLLTAQVATKAQNLLQNYITDYKIKSADEQLKFINKRYLEKKGEYEAAQMRLASFLQRNQNMFSASMKAEQDKLQNDCDIANSVYTELAKMREQSLIQVKKKTPDFEIIKPVMVPTEKSKPKRGMIVVVCTFIGAVIGAGTLFGKDYWGYLNKKSDKAGNIKVQES